MSGTFLCEVRGVGLAEVFRTSAFDPPCRKIWIDPESNRVDADGSKQTDAYYASAIPWLVRVVSEQSRINDGHNLYCRNHRIY